MTESIDSRKPLEREEDNLRSGDARKRPAQQGDPAADESYGPFGRGDREPQSDGKAPREDRV